MKHQVSIDYMRAAKAYLDIVLHAAFIIIIYNDLVSKSSSLAISFLTLIITFIHSFRIEIFFILAAYFSAYQMSTRSLKHYILSRLKTIAVPLIILYILYKTPIILDLILTHLNTENLSNHHSLISSNNVNHLLIKNLEQLSYLWFLYFLLLYYSETLILRYLLRLILKEETSITTVWFWIFQKRASIVLFFLLTTIITMHHFDITLHLSSSWKPNIVIFLFYYVFFIMGWLFYQSQSAWHIFKNNRYVYFAIATCLLIILFNHEISHGGLIADINKNPKFTLKIAHNLMVWLFTYSIIGMFPQLTKERGVRRYLSQSSYWVYLSDFPVLLFIIPILNHFSSNVTVTFITSSIITTAIVLLSYQCFVRKTWIGMLLNGKKYPKAT